MKVFMNELYSTTSLENVHSDNNSATSLNAVFMGSHLNRFLGICSLFNYSSHLVNIMDSSGKLHTSQIVKYSIEVYVSKLRPTVTYDD